MPTATAFVVFVAAATVFSTISLSDGQLTLPPYTMSKWHTDLFPQSIGSTFFACDYLETELDGWGRKYDTQHTAFMALSLFPTAQMLRLDPTTGEILWTTSLPSLTIVDTQCYSTQVILAASTIVLAVNTSNGSVAWTVSPASTFQVSALIAVPPFPVGVPVLQQRWKPYVYALTTSTLTFGGLYNYSLLKIDVPSGSYTSFNFSLTNYQSLSAPSVQYYNSTAFETDYLVGLLSQSFSSSFGQYLVVLLNGGRVEAMTTTIVTTTVAQPLQVPFYIFSDVVYFYFVDGAGYENINGFRLLNAMLHYSYQRYVYWDESSVLTWSGHVNSTRLSSLTFVLLRTRRVQFVSGTTPSGSLIGSVNCSSSSWGLMLTTQPVNSFGDGDWYLYEPGDNAVSRLTLATASVRWRYLPPRTVDQPPSPAFVLPDGNLYLQTSPLSSEFAPSGSMYLLQVRVEDGRPLTEFFFAQGDLLGLAWTGGQGGTPSSSSGLLIAATQATARGLLPSTEGSVLHYNSAVTATRPLFLTGVGSPGWGSDDTVCFTHGSSISAVTLVGSASGFGDAEWKTRWTVNTAGAATFATAKPLLFGGYLYYFAQFSNAVNPYQFIRVHAAVGSWDTITLTRAALDGCDPSGIDSELVGDPLTGAIWWFRGSCVITMDTHLVFTGIDLGHTPVGSPIIVGLTVYVLRSDGYIVSLDTTFLGISGLTQKTSDRVLAANPSTSMLLLGDNFYFTCGHGTVLLVQYDRFTLKLVQFQRVGPMGTPLTTSGPGTLAPFLYGDNLYLPTNYGSLIQMTPWNGTYMRGFEVFTAANTTLMYPAITSDGVFIFSCEQGIFAIASWGSLLWSTTSRPERNELLDCGQPHIRGSTVVVGCNNELHIVNLYTGEVMLSGPQGPLSGATLVSPTTGAVYVFDASQVWYLRDTYTAVGSFPLPPEAPSKAGLYAGLTIVVLFLALVVVGGAVVLLRKKSKTQQGTTTTAESQQPPQRTNKVSESTPLLAAQATPEVQAAAPPSERREYSPPAQSVEVNSTERDEDDPPAPTESAEPAAPPATTAVSTDNPTEAPTATAVDVESPPG